jgi:hypothetical protein
MFNFFKSKDTQTTQLSTSPFFKKEKEIKAWLKFHHINEYYLTKDLEVNVDENVFLHREKISYLPVQFNHIKGSFYCSNQELTSLTGAPFIVDGHFNVSDNKLTSLAGAPRKVGGRFEVKNNQLESLFCMPYEMQSLHASGNKLNTLEGLGSVELTDKKMITLMLGDNPLDSLKSIKELYTFIENHLYRPFNIELDYLTVYMTKNNIAYDEKINVLKELLLPIIEKEKLDKKFKDEPISIQTKKIKL